MVKEFIQRQLGFLDSVSKSNDEFDSTQGGEKSPSFLQG